MKYLVYGIMPAASADAVASLPTKEKGREEREAGGVRFVCAQGLAAAYSLRPQAETAPQVSQLVAYASVIEDLWHLGPILPMRYGCWLDGDKEVEELLQRRQSVFAKALREVAGCVEMGVRVKPIQAEPAVVIQSSKPAPTSGANYLSQRQALFAAQDRGRLEAAGLTEIIHAAFAGQVVKAKTEGGPGQPCPLLSLHFLVRAEQVDSFRMTFRRLQAARTEQLLLSGPWPPYNFAAD